MKHCTKAPLAIVGVVWRSQTGGFYGLVGFHMGLFLDKVPAVNPSVTAPPCQLPLAREPCGVPPLTFGL